MINIRPDDRMRILYLIQCNYLIVSFSREQLAITGNPDHVVHDEDMSDRSFVDTTCVCGASKWREERKRLPQESASGGSNLERGRSQRRLQELLEGE